MPERQTRRLRRVAPSTSPIYIGKLVHFLAEAKWFFEGIFCETRGICLTKPGKIVLIVL